MHNRLYARKPAAWKFAMAKNILIFSDGTGQAGGIRFYENRTNIY